MSEIKLESGFYNYYNYQTFDNYKEKFGSKKLPMAWRGVYADIGNKYAHIIDWATGKEAKVDLKDFHRHSIPANPRKFIIKARVKALTKKRSDISMDTGIVRTYKLKGKTKLIKKMLKAVS